MKIIRSVLIGAMLALATPLAAFGQCSGQAGANTYCGNNTGSTALPGWKPMGGFAVDLDIGSTTVTGGSTGRLLYDNAGVLGEVATTATARQMLQSGATAAPVWSAATWPATTVANQILYSSATNTVAGLATANYSVLVTNGSGVPSLSTSLPSGIILPSTALANPTASVGLVAVNGAALTAMRSDAAPVLSQAITPTWSGFHTFGAGLSSTFVTTPNVYGGGAANSTLSLQSTSNVSPSGDVTTISGSNVRFQNYGTSRAYYDFYDHFARSQMQLRGIVKRDVDNVRSIAGIINPGFSIDDGVQRVGDIDFLVCGSGGVANADCDGLGTGETLQAGLAITGPVAGLGGGGLIPFTDNSYIIGWPSQRFKDLQVVTGTFGGVLTAQAGVVVSAGGVQIGNANTLSWANGSSLYGDATTGANLHTFRLAGSGATTALNFGGDTSSFPALVRNATALEARLADNSADAPFTALSFNGLTVTTSTGALTVANAKTLTANNTLTLTATDGATLAVGAGGTLGSNAYTSTAYAPLASPTFTGTVTIPAPFTLGATSVTSTGTQLNYLAAATGTTGTTSSNVVFSASPTLTGTVTVPAFTAPAATSLSFNAPTGQNMQFKINNVGELIVQAGNVYPVTDNVTVLGGVSNRWSAVVATQYYAGAAVPGLASKTCTINTANVTTGITITITGGIVTGTTTC